jgi:hypothetical protein
LKHRGGYKQDVLNWMFQSKGISWRAVIPQLVYWLGCVLDEQGLRISFLAGLRYMSLLPGLPSVLSNVYWRLRCLYLWVLVLRHWMICAQCLQIVSWPRFVIIVCWRMFQTLKMRFLWWNSGHQHHNSEHTSTAPL